MFWRIPNFSTTSPVETILDKENFTLEELLDEEEIIQECKALNTRLINFLRDRAQVEQLLRFIVEDASEDSESKRAFKFPFIACEIFTCEIDVILKTLVEDEELMNMLFSFLEPNRTHSSLLAGYFSKVVICLMLRKTTSLMNYVQIHKSIFQQLVDLIGITSIMEILIRLVGGDDHTYPSFLDVMQWLADGDLLEMIVDKLNPSSSSEVHANAAEVLLAIIRNSPSALAAKLASPSFVARIFGHALEDTLSKSALVHSLSVCIYLLDPKRSTATTLVHSVRSQHLYEPPITVDPETTRAMLPKLGDLLKLLDVSSDVNVLPTTFGELRPPLGKHRLKIVEFIAVLLGTGDEVAQNELISSGAIQRILDLFFEYPFNNTLHHHVESIIYTCLESRNTIVDHLFCDCNIILRFLQADNKPIVSIESSSITRPIAGRQGPRSGNIGHITQIANKLIQLGNSNDHIQSYLQENREWVDWQTNVLHERNAKENVYRWACGRPTALQERTRDSDEDELQDRDYDVTSLANNLSQAFRYCTYENDDAEEDVYFDDESAEVVISSLRLGDDSESSLFTNSNWFAFQDDKISEDPVSTSTCNRMDGTNPNGTASSCNSNDEEVVVREEVVSRDVYTETDTEIMSGTKINGFMDEQASEVEKASNLGNIGLFQFEVRGNEDLFNDQQLPEWVGWREPCDIMVDESAGDRSTQSDPADPAVSVTPNNTLESCGLDETEKAVPSLFEEDAEFVGVELEGMGRAMRLGSKGRLNCELKKPCQDGTGMMEFSDKSPWRVEPEVGVVQE